MYIRRKFCIGCKVFKLTLYYLIDNILFNINAANILNHLVNLSFYSQLVKFLNVCILVLTTAKDASLTY